MFVGTDDPGLARNIMELFLDEIGKRHLWYESSWLSYPAYQEIRPNQCREDDWKGWSRELVLSKTNSKNKKKDLPSFFSFLK